MREEDIKYRKRQKFMKLLKKAGLFVLGTVICAVVVIFSILIGAGLLGSNGDHWCGALCSVSDDIYRN